ncbi:MAG TPA: hypothetical protein VE715_04035 [Blastocatellia bacterium]|nr:hypothetical protein [Blastocatellia bacterium]
MQAETLHIFLVIFAGLNIVLLIFALRVVWKYTKEIEVVGKYMGEIEKIRQALTRQSEELASQRRLSVLPTLAAWLKQDESGSPIHRLYLKNVGNGIAMNIEIARIDFIAIHKDVLATNTDDDVDERDNYRIPTGQSGYSVFQPIQTLSPNCEQAVKSFNYPSDPDHAGEVIRQYGYTGFDFLSLIDEETPLNIDFQDVEGNKYHQVIRRKGDTFAPGPVESQTIYRTRASAN